MSAAAQPARFLQLSRPLAFFDLETTGTDIAEDRIVDIAVLKLLPGGTEEALHSLINPGVPIPPSATEVHGIRDADVQAKPTFAQIAPGLGIPVKVNDDSSGKPNGIPVKANSRRSEATLACSLCLEVFGFVKIGAPQGGPGAKRRSFGGDLGCRGKGRPAPLSPAYPCRSTTHF